MYTYTIILSVDILWQTMGPNHPWVFCHQAVTQLHFMYSKWADAFSQFQAFAEVTRKAAMDKGDQRLSRAEDVCCCLVVIVGYHLLN